MTARTARRLAWGIWAASIAAYFGAFIHAVFGSGTWLWFIAIAISAFIAAFLTVGALIASRRPENPIGWLMIASGVCFVIPVVLAELGSSVEQLNEWFGSWIYAVALGLAATFVLLLFPDGHLPSPRWRWAARVAGTGIAVFVIGSMLQPGAVSDSSSTNPFGVGGSIGRAIFGEMRSIGLLVLAISVPVSIASLFFRRRHADHAGREQLRWLTYAAGLVFLGMIPARVILTTLHVDVTVVNSVLILSVSALPIAIGFAVLKYRLYDIDIVIRKTVVFGVLAVFITGVYAGIVGGIGALVHSRGSTTLSFAAAAALAVLFQPARERARRFADRVTYGKRATPYEVLAEFSGNVGETYATADVLPRMAQVLANGTGADSAKVYLKVGGELRLAASFGEAGGGEEHLVEVTDRGEELGALAVTMPPSDPMDGVKEKLVRDLAGQAGLVLRNVRLIEELRASRQRLVTAQDEERRKLERNLHDGAQQQLVALAVKLRLAQAVASKEDAAQTAQQLTALQQDAQDALENLRDLARGIYPPLLADKGLGPALESQVRKAVMPTSVEANGVGRHDQDVEAAVYFCVLEALNNIAKYAEATQATVALAQEDGHLAFSVTDDGMGFDTDTNRYGTGLQGMADRLDAVGGSLDVTSRPGAGTTVSGRIPVLTSTNQETRR